MAPASTLEDPERPPLVEIDQLRGRLEATAQSERARLQTQALDRETRWEGYAARSDSRFVALLGVMTEANRCTVRARSANHDER